MTKLSTIIAAFDGSLEIRVFSVAGSMFAAVVALTAWYWLKRLGFAAPRKSKLARSRCLAKVFAGCGAGCGFVHINMVLWCCLWGAQCQMGFLFKCLLQPSVFTPLRVPTRPFNNL